MKRIRTDIENARLLTLAEACIITGMGKTRCRQFCDKWGATRILSPRMVRYDRKTIDRVLDEMESAAVTDETA